MQSSKCAATLMQEEKIGDDARAQDCRDCAEEAGEEPRDDIRDIVVGVGHDGSPDLTD